MNEIKSFLFQSIKVVYYGYNQRWDWEIKLAIGDDGNYYGIASCSYRMYNNYPWIPTETSDLEEALEIMRKHCLDMMSK